MPMTSAAVSGWRKSTALISAPMWIVIGLTITWMAAAPGADSTGVRIICLSAAMLY